MRSIRSPRPAVGCDSVAGIAVALAAGCYAANVALGLSVASRLVDTSNARWIHHGLFIATATSTGVALALSGIRREASALPLAATAAPLVLLQRHGSRPLARHTRTAMLAAPGYVIALALARR
ncbi:hypothetical protein [Brachybacterium sp. GCM10030252]|uniref:hypothetical protein n=1 Tax=Brachybacterium sp. GCM10030252 TaxID=3273380 RepID=UPI00361A0451